MLNPLFPDKNIKFPKSEIVCAVKLIGVFSTNSSPSELRFIIK